jgi:NitT/TauT family transport system ATP-binding protein
LSIGSALDEVTAGDLRKPFIALAHEIDATAILITHQLEEAVEVGECNRIRQGSCAVG